MSQVASRHNMAANEIGASHQRRRITDNGLYFHAIAVYAILAFAILPHPTHAATLSQARSSAISWLESHQNPDGSWGSGTTRPLVTSEALLALAKANRAEGAPGQRAQVWLLNQEPSSLDFRSRAVRALQASGVDVSREAAALNALGYTASCSSSTGGWGPTSEKGVTSYDTALVLAAIKAGGLTPVDGCGKALNSGENRV